MTVTDLLRAELEAPQKATRSLSGRPLTRVHGGSWLRAYKATMVGLDALLALLVGAALLARADGPVAVYWAVALPVAWVLVAALCGAYRPNILGAGAHDLRAICAAGVALFAVVPLVPLLGVDLAYDVSVVLGLAAITTGAGLIRWVSRTIINARRRTGHCTQTMFLAGDADAVVDMVLRLRRTATAVRPVGLAVPTSQVELVARLGLPVVGFDDDIETLDVDKIVGAARESLADGVLLASGRGVENDVLRRVGRACEWHELPLFLAPSVVDVATSATVTPLAGLPVMAISRPGPAGAGRFAKGVVDRGGASLGLLLLAPLMLGVALAVRLDSRGPALFRQTRVGEGGRQFRMIKFRSMHIGAESLVSELAHLNEADGTLFKIRDDPRVTRLGRILRRTSLDELPQLFNVLSGRMSLVGPRPPLPSEVDTYTTAERRRLLVKPGMTGLWQVGGRSNLSWVDSVRLDLRYVDSWSLSLDVRILMRTLPEVLRRNGAC